MKLCLNEGLCIYICASLENSQVKEVLQQAWWLVKLGMLQIYQLKFKYGDATTVACGVQCRRCWRACNTILSQQQALAKQAQKHTACLEAHDQVQNYSRLSVGVCTFVSHLFCESTELSLQTMTCEQIHRCSHPFSTLVNPGALLLKRNMNNMIPFALENYTLGWVGYAKNWLHIIL